jgi:adenylate cyclase
MTASAIVCTSCGAEPSRAGAPYCDACGNPLTAPDSRPEFKQVTVLFADVVGSMDIAAVVGAERMREIMAGLVHRGTAVVHRYGGAMDRFTGDGLMAVFGAPVALEDHALRACLAALNMRTQTQRLADEVRCRDGIELQLRVGLNSGQVVAGQIGSGVPGYTAVGEQVGLARRMESVAPGCGPIASPTPKMFRSMRLRTCCARSSVCDRPRQRGRAHPHPGTSSRCRPTGSDAAR